MRKYGIYPDVYSKISLYRSENNQVAFDLQCIAQLMSDNKYKKEKDKDMNLKKYSIQAILAKEANLKIIQQEFEVKGICKSSLITSSSLHKHKRKQPS